MDSKLGKEVNINNEGLTEKTVVGINGLDV